MAKYSMDQIRAWAERYKMLLSFSAVGKEFVINENTIRYHILKHKHELCIEPVVKRINKAFGLVDGMKRCSNPKCSIKPLSEFYFNKSRKKYKPECKSCEKERAHVHYAKNPARHKEKTAKWVQNNRELARQSCKRWYSKNKESVKARTAQNTREARKTPTGKLRSAIRGGVRRLFETANTIKTKKFANIGLKHLGCSVLEFKTYIESLWLSGMTWENYGYYGWHLDHTIPIAAIKDINDLEQIKKVCHYTNLRPLWAQDNLKKGAKIEENSNVD